ncbi:MAG: lytic murein transglycosylase B [Pseudomonadota bacterium]
MLPSSKILRHTRRLSVAALALLLAWAPARTALAGDYAGNPDMQALVNELAQEEGIDRAATLALLGGAKRKQAILDAIAKPAEKALSWAEYRPRFIDDKRIIQGLEFWAMHEEALARAEKTYGVAPEFIVAIIGVETRFGRNKGSWRIVDALSTLAFDYPPRATFFRDQLKEFVRLERSAHIRLADATGSYAGAMGFPQFMPSSYRAYAVDFDNDDVIDLINNPVDAIGSVANYFKVHGWKAGEPVAARAAVVAMNYDRVTNQGLEPKFTVRDIEQAGLAVLSCRDDGGLPVEYCADPSPDEKATALKLDGEYGAEFWVAFRNFYVITRYNRSDKYSLTVTQLAREVRKARLAAGKAAAGG